MAKLGELTTICNGRLTLTSGTPETITDVTAATTVYFTPYKGNNIALYNTTHEEWVFYEFAERSISLSGKTADTNYDVYIYDSSGTLTLELVAWTDDTTRATALATQDGIYVKTGELNKRFLGTIRTTSTTGQCEDSETKRYVSNYYNRLPRPMYKYTTDEHSYNSTTIRAWNNNSANKVEFLVCVDMVVVCNQLVLQVRSTGTGHELALQFDSTTSYNARLARTVNNNHSIDFQIRSGSGAARPGKGYHAIQVNQRAWNNSTFYNYTIGFHIEM